MSLGTPLPLASHQPRPCSSPARRWRPDRRQGTPAALGRLGGSIGRGAVIDFIDLQHFADFNVADSCLTRGVVLALLLLLRGIPMTDDAGADMPYLHPIGQ
jgi:hypothetical protein